VHVSCDSYTWIDGNTYTSSNNTATHILINASGCDSVVTLDLTITSSTFFTDVHVSCDSYTWIDGNTYTSSNNTATHILTNASGCDSVVTLDLTINTVNAAVVVVDDSTLQAQAVTPGITYQWVDCNDNFAPIPLETNATFTTQNSGYYAVEVTFNDCSAISDCFTIAPFISLCDSFEVTDVIIDNFNLTIGIGIYNGLNSFLNYPYVAFTLDSSGDTIQEGNMNLFGAINLDTTWYNYSFLNPLNPIYPLNIYFVYYVGSMLEDTCILTYNLTPTVIADINQSDYRKLISIVDMLGKETKSKINIPLFYIFDDGTVEKKIIFE
jgi:hypothetical protein